MFLENYLYESRLKQLNFIYIEVGLMELFFDVITRMPLVKNAGIATKFKRVKQYRTSV